MNFKEAFEHYRAGTATPEETDAVELELEKNRLISEYLADEFPVDFAVGESPADELKNVRKSIRRRSRNIVITAVAIVAALALIFYFAGMPLLKGLYYDPTTHAESPYSNDIDISLSAYTELHFPGYYHNSSLIENTGAGIYKMTLIRGSLTTGKSEYFPATLDKNILTMPQEFNPRTFPVNFFARATYPIYNLDDEPKTKYEKGLSELPDYLDVSAAVSLSEDLTMDQLADLKNGSKLNFLWAGIRNAPEGIQRLPLCGMELTGTGPIYDKINASYPAFELSMLPNKKALSAADYENHFTSLLRYVTDHPAFLNALDASDMAYYRSVLGYITENGVKTYGVLVVGSAADILALKNTGVVSQIWPMGAEVSLYKG
jgi:hypothetical protein